MSHLCRSPRSRQRVLAGVRGCTQALPTMNASGMSIRSVSIGRCRRVGGSGMYGRAAGTSGLERQRRVSHGELRRQERHMAQFGRLRMGAASGSRRGGLRRGRERDPLTLALRKGRRSPPLDEGRGGAVNAWARHTHRPSAGVGFLWGQETDSVPAS